MSEKIISYEDWKLEVFFLSKRIEAYNNIDKKFISHTDIHSIINNEEECINILSNNLNKSQEELRKILNAVISDMEEKEPHIFRDHIKLLQHYYKKDNPQEIAINFYQFDLADFNEHKDSLIEHLKTGTVFIAVGGVFLLILERFGFIFN